MRARCEACSTSSKHTSREISESSPCVSIHEVRIFSCPRGRALRKIPYGETRSYADIARAIGRPTATRAVGAANGRNPIPIIVPCHRVIGSDGSLTGFGGGIPTKRKLLALEGVTLVP